MDDARVDGRRPGGFRARILFSDTGTGLELTTDFSFAPTLPLERGA
jgi:hypothetical protein